MDLHEKFEKVLEQKNEKDVASKGLYARNVLDYCHRFFKRMNVEVIKLSDENTILFEKYPYFFKILDNVHGMTMQMDSHWCGLYYTERTIDFKIEGLINNDDALLKIKTNYDLIRKSDFIKNEKVFKKENGLRCLFFSFDYLDYLESEVSGGSIYVKFDDYIKNEKRKEITV